MDGISNQLYNITSAFAAPALVLVRSQEQGERESWKKAVMHSDPLHAKARETYTHPLPLSFAAVRRSYRGNGPYIPTQHARRERKK